MDDRIQAVMEAYGSGSCNCAQSLIVAYAADMGIEVQVAHDLFEGLGGGIGGCQDACGAVTTMACIVGWKCNKLGYDKPALYAKVHEACERFRATYGTLTCLDILDGAPPTPQCCPHVVERAAQIIEGLDY